MASNDQYQMLAKYSSPRSMCVLYPSLHTNDLLNFPLLVSIGGCQIWYYSELIYYQILMQ